MGLFAKLLGTDQASLQRTFHKLHREAKSKRPDRSEADIMRLILLTKPPFDYQLDEVIDEILGQCSTVDELAQEVAMYLGHSDMRVRMFEARERNLKMFPRVQERNEEFFRYFWSGA